MGSVLTLFPTALYPPAFSRSHRLDDLPLWIAHKLPQSSPTEVFSPHASRTYPYLPPAVLIDRRRHSSEQPPGVGLLHLARLPATAHHGVSPCSVAATANTEKHADTVRADSRRLPANLVSESYRTCHCQVHRTPRSRAPSHLLASKRCSLQARLSCARSPIQHLSSHVRTCVRAPCTRRVSKVLQALPSGAPCSLTHPPLHSHSTSPPACVSQVPASAAHTRARCPVRPTPQYRLSPTAGVMTHSRRTSRATYQSHCEPGSASDAPENDERVRTALRAPQNHTKPRAYAVFSLTGCCMAITRLDKLPPLTRGSGAHSGTRDTPSAHSGDSPFASPSPSPGKCAFAQY